MIEQALGGRDPRPGDRARHARRGGARPARLHDRSASGRGRCAVWRRAGHGAEAGAAVPGARRDRGASGGRPLHGRADVAAGHAVHAGRRAAAEPDGRTSCCCAGGTRGSTSACATRVDEEISIGDYVLSGGELPALVIVDAVARLVPGVVGTSSRSRRIRSAAGCWTFRSTRGRRRSRQADATADGARRAAVGQPRGNPAWRKREALARTLERRPELLAQAELDDEERRCCARCWRSAETDRRSGRTRRSRQ